MANRPWWIPITLGGIAAGLTSYNKKKKAQAEAQAKANKAKKKEEEDKKNDQISYHKTSKSTIGNKDHPDWHYHNFQQMNLEREKAKDPNMPQLSEDDYKNQFMTDVYKPENYAKWGNITTKNPNLPAGFKPTEEQIELGQKYVQYEREKTQEYESKKQLEEAGKDTEGEIEGKIARLEKQKYVAEVYNSVQKMTEEQVMAKYPGITKELIQLMKSTGSVKGLLAGDDADIPPIWTDREQKQYVNLVRTYNESQRIQGSTNTYSMLEGRSRAEQLVQFGVLKQEDVKDEEKIKTAETTLEKDYPVTKIAPNIQAVSDSLTTSIKNLEDKYGDRLEHQFEEVKRRLKWREEENK